MHVRTYESLKLCSTDRAGLRAVRGIRMEVPTAATSTDPTAIPTDAQRISLARASGGYTIAGLLRLRPWQVLA